MCRVAVTKFYDKNGRSWPDESGAMFILFTESYLHHLSFTTQMWSDVNASYIVVNVMINVWELECRVIKCQLIWYTISNSMFRIINWTVIHHSQHTTDMSWLQSAFFVTSSWIKKKIMPTQQTAEMLAW